MKNILIALTLLTASLSAQAATRTVTLDLPSMNCAMCPITVKKALDKLEGVSKAEVSFDDKRAVVTFDDTATSTEALVEATTNAGYPSTVVK
ncbi:mercury resistance system periplasmic binding protein MerP [Microbulbifer magnicolonia]|uniref:mercury resistance system periplasmic binding protein MerP n=1 Tax=Microbulbifer magnicolonia TaxID=3109744 RepID=UPI002B411F08|nr:mercury resistance system periplasmic binding protein MerP [Microbulbifer sp. GG15]